MTAPDSSPQPGPVGPRHVLAVASRLDAVPGARDRFIRSLLRGGCGPRLADDAAVVMSELLMNSLIHGTPDDDGCVRVEWANLDDGSVWVRVRDSGSAHPAGQSVPAPDGEVSVREPEPFAEGGRGMKLVESFSASWTVDTTDGTTVTAVLSRERPD